jgi:hypothetical protein
MDLMATSEVYDHEETAPVGSETSDPQQPGESDNKFQKAIAVWRGMYQNLNASPLPAMC